MKSSNLWPVLKAKAKALIEARGEALRDDAARRFDPMTAPGRSASAFMRARYVKSARLYRQADGWGVDIELDRRKLPAGVPLVFGTPVSTPHPDAASAMGAGVHMAAMLILADERPETPPDDPGFELYGHQVMLDRAAVEKVAGVWRRLEKELGEDAAASRAVALLEEALSRSGVFGESVLARGTDLPDPEAAAALHVAICLCVLARVPRYPERFAQIEENDPSQPRH